MSEVEVSTHAFQAETAQVLNLVVNSLYSNKDIFLRELISNAADAIDKRRLQGDDFSPQITIKANETNQTLTITDNGIGMDSEGLSKQLGTIAHSGTRAFLESLKEKNASQLIGQFGVGFYSAFMVSSEVKVVSRALNATQAATWSSTGDGTYQMGPGTRDEVGTTIILKIKPEEKPFLSNWRLGEIIRRYSDHISVPIMLWVEKTKENDATEYEWDQVNKASALWVRGKQEISEEEYQNFYQYLSHDMEKPLLWSHNHVEGKSHYTNLLYLPKKAPFDLWNRDKPRGLKLYVQRVFIMDDAEQFLPRYLRFVQGVLDAKNLPLNVSREILQSSREVDHIRQGLVKRVLGLLEQLSQDKEKYEGFWKDFGPVLKEGLVEDQSNKDQLAKLLRFRTTRADLVSLDSYIQNMPKEQEKIFYLTAESLSTAQLSPHLERFKKRGIEVLLLTDPVDEWMVGYLPEYEGKSLQSVAKGEIDAEQLKETPDEQEAFKKAEKDLESVVSDIENILKDKVKTVRLSHRLVDSPACVVLEEHDLSGHLQRILKQAGQDVPTAKPILELNPQHALITRLKDEQDDSRLSDWAHLLLEQALLSESGQLESPALFVSRLNKLLLAR